MWVRYRDQEVREKCVECAASMLDYGWVSWREEIFDAYRAIKTKGRQGE
jgi:hypothetical protein